MTPQRLRLRAVTALGLVLGALALLLGRLAWLQIVDGAAMAAAGARQHMTRVEVDRALRGRILDRNGQVLAETESYPSVAVDPKLVREPAAFAAIVARELRIPAEAVRAAIDRGNAARAQSKPGGRFQWLARQVPDRPSVERLVRTLRAERMEGLVVDEEPKRTYPLGALAAHVLGFTDRDGKGREGVEALCEKELAGRDGRRVTLRDAAGMPIDLGDRPFDPAVPGADVTLTVDATIQSFTEDASNRAWTESGAKGVVAVVVDVRTGDVLGSACRPTFDPNFPSRSTPDQRRNRLVTDAFEPGSVFKPLVLAAALDAGTVAPDTRIDTQGGALRLRGRTIHEDKRHDYGVMSLTQVMARSSNVAMAQIGLRMGTPSMKSALARFGFGERTALRWPGEQPGDVQAKRTWRDSDQLASSAFGHAITTTPAQLVQGFAVLAAGGERRGLRILADAPAPEPVRVISAESAAALLPMLEAVLTDPNGTARSAARHCPDYRVAGKTGTAQKLQTGGHVASFACVGPVGADPDAPCLAVLVLADEPSKATYGSVVAAPYALRLLRESLHYLEVTPRRRDAVASAPPPRRVPPEVPPR